MSSDIVSDEGCGSRTGLGGGEVHRAAPRAHAVAAAAVSFHTDIVLGFGGKAGECLGGRATGHIHRSGTGEVGSRAVFKYPCIFSSHSMAFPCQGGLMRRHTGICERLWLETAGKFLHHNIIHIAAVVS